MQAECRRPKAGSLRIGALLIALGLSACGGDGGGSPTEPSAADRLTEALINKVTVGNTVAALIRGAPPADTGPAGRPTISTSKSVAAKPGEVATIVVNIDSAQNLSHLFARIPGASSFFRAALPAQGAIKSGAIGQAKLSFAAQVKIAVPADRANGELICFDFSVEDVGKLVSDTAQACVKVQTGSVPVGPTVVGSAPESPAIGTNVFTDVAVVGDLAYAADLAVALSIFDVGNRRSPRLVGGVEIPPCCPRAIAVASGRAYVAAGTAGLQIVDVVSNTSAPTIVGKLATAGGQAEDVAVVDNHVYIIDYNSGLIIADVANPSAPAVLGTLAFSGSKANAIAVNGSRAYVGTVGAGSDVFFIVDVSNPATPTVLGQLSLPLGIQALAVKGNIVYINVKSVNDSGKTLVYAVDVTNPATPATLGSLEIAGYDSSTEVADDPFFRGTVGIAVAGDTVVAASNSGTYLIDAGNPGNLTLLGSVSGESNAVAARGDLAFVARGADLGVIDFSNPVSPLVVAYASTQLTAAATVVGTRAYLTGAAGLEIFDLSNPLAPSRLGSLTEIERLQGNVVAGNFIYIAAADSSPLGGPANSGLRIADISDPAAPRFVGSVVGYSEDGIISDAIDVAVSGDRAYVADRAEQAINVIDVSSPTAPAIIGKVNVSSRPVKLFVSGNLLFSGGEEDTDIFDISNRSAPQARGKINGASAVTVIGDRAYAAGNDGVQIIDVSDPANPQEIGQVDAPTKEASSIVKVGNLLYVAPRRGLAIVDVSDPENPLLVANPATGAPATSLAVNGNYAFFSTLRLGFNVMDLGVYAGP